MFMFGALSNELKGGDPMSSDFVLCYEASEDMVIEGTASRT
jgi:hypothetical protein